MKRTPENLKVIDGVKWWRFAVVGAPVWIAAIDGENRVEKGCPCGCGPYVLRLCEER